MSKCPWARYWSPSCSWCAVQNLSWQPASVHELMNYCKLFWTKASAKCELCDLTLWRELFYGQCNTCAVVCCLFYHLHVLYRTELELCYKALARGWLHENVSMLMKAAPQCTLTELLTWLETPTLFNKTDFLLSTYSVSCFLWLCQWLLIMQSFLPSLLKVLWITKTFSQFYRSSELHDEKVPRVFVSAAENQRISGEKKVQYG